MARAQPATSAADFLPEQRDLADLGRAAKQCRGCDLYRDATQTVFGEGPAHARLLFVGEQPGDAEDVQGKPFVGPAGKLLRRALRDVGIDDSDVYITNAVKHFKYVVRGIRRIHASPRVIEMRACFPWLEAEIAAVQPEIVVALGATAARALLGNTFRLTANRGVVVASPIAPKVIATVHPSSILRAPDAGRADQLERFRADLAVVERALAV